MQAVGADNDSGDQIPEHRTQPEITEQRHRNDSGDQEDQQEFERAVGMNDVRMISMGKPKARSEEHTSELQSLMRISYAVFCLKKKNKEHKEHKRRAN